MGKESLGRNIDTERLDGYPAFASFIAQDRNVSIFRKFATLDSRTLLYLQSELNDLEEKLNAFDKQDVYGDVQARTSARSWDDFSRNAKEREHEKERMELVNTIRQKLTIYRKAHIFGSPDFLLELCKADKKQTKHYFSQAKSFNSLLLPLGTWHLYGYGLQTRFPFWQAEIKISSLTLKISLVSVPVTKIVSKSSLRNILAIS
jgi:hypothetical protein